MPRGQIGFKAVWTRGHGQLVPRSVPRKPPTVRVLSPTLLVVNGTYDDHFPLSIEEVSIVNEIAVVVVVVGRACKGRAPQILRFQQQVRLLDERLKAPDAQLLGARIRMRQEHKQCPVGIP